MSEENKQLENTTEKTSLVEQSAPDPLEAEKALTRIDALFIRLDDENENEAESALRIIRRLMPKAGISFQHIRASIGSGQMSQEMLDAAVAEAVAEYATVNDQLKESEGLLLAEIEKLNLMLAYFGKNDLAGVKINADDLKARLNHLAPRLKEAADHLAQYKLPDTADLEAKLKTHLATVVLNHNTYNDTTGYLGLAGQSYLWALRRLCGYNVDPKHLDNLKKTAETLDVELKRIEIDLSEKINIATTQINTLIDILTPLTALSLGTQKDFDIAMRNLIKAEEKLKTLDQVNAERLAYKAEAERLAQLLDEEKIKTKALLADLKDKGKTSPSVIDTIRQKLQAKGYLTFSEQERLEYMDAMRDFEGAVQTEMKKRQTAEQLQIAELETKLKAQADVIQNLSAQTSAIFAANDLTAINQLAKMSSEQAFMAEQLGEATKTLKDELAQKKTKPWYKKLLGFFGTQSEAEILASQLEIIAEKMERAQRDLQKTNAQNKVLQDGFNREAKKATDTLKAQVTKLEKLTKRQKRASNSTAA